MRTRALALILALLPMAAAAQQFPTINDGNVIGRIGTGSSSGPSQQIPFAKLGLLIGALPPGISVVNPGTGKLEMVLPPETCTLAANAYTLVVTDLFKEMRCSNSGTNYTLTFPAASTAGLVNGTRIQLNNIDATATATLSASSGTQINGGASASLGPARSSWWIYDTTVSPPNWRSTMNSLTVLLSSNNLSDLASAATARGNLGLAGVYSVAAVAHQWINSITAGVANLSQPAIADISGWGSGVTTALGVNVGTAGAFVVQGGALGTPSGGILGTGITIQAGNVTWSGTIPGANMAAVNLAAGNVNGGVFGTLPAANLPVATISSPGIVQPDGSTITISGGVITASGSSATAITPGTTTISGGSENPGYALTNSGGMLANNQLYSTAGGLLNKFRNGTFDVAQRGISITASTTCCSYTLDGWIVLPTAATATVAQASAFTTGLGSSANLLRITGGSSTTDARLSQRIESAMMAQLVSKTVTFQIAFSQSIGGTVTPKITTCYPTTTNTFSANLCGGSGVTTDLAATSLQSCAVNTLCTLSYTFTVSASATTGYEVDFDCNCTLGTANIQFMAADIRATPGVSTGLNSNPPSPELRPIGVELPLNQRYFTTTYGNGVAPGTATHTGMIFIGTYVNGSFIGATSPQFPTQMRVAPSVSYFDGAGNSSKLTVSPVANTALTYTDNTASSAGAIQNIGAAGFISNLQNVGNHSFIHYTASAEL